MQACLSFDHKHSCEHFTLASALRRYLSTSARNMSSWNRLVRFVAQEDGKTYQGEPQYPKDDASFDIGTQYEGVKVKVIDGDIYTDAKVTDQVKTIKKLLSPVSKEQITMFRCVGLNYVKHSMLLVLQFSCMSTTTNFDLPCLVQSRKDT